MKDVEQIAIGRNCFFVVYENSIRATAWNARKNKQNDVWLLHIQKQLKLWIKKLPKRCRSVFIVSKN